MQRRMSICCNVRLDCRSSAITQKLVHKYSMNHLRTALADSICETLRAKINLKWRPHYADESLYIPQEKTNKKGFAARSECNVVVMARPCSRTIHTYAHPRNQGTITFEGSKSSKIWPTLDYNLAWSHLFFLENRRICNPTVSVWEPIEFPSSFPELYVRLQFRVGQT